MDLSFFMEVDYVKAVQLKTMERIERIGKFTYKKMSFGTLNIYRGLLQWLRESIQKN